MYIRVTTFVVHICFFFFKQKTAYEMRISDWSSDVCSSDLKHKTMFAKSWPIGVPLKLAAQYQISPPSFGLRGFSLFSQPRNLSKVIACLVAAPNSQKGHSLCRRTLREERCAIPERQVHALSRSEARRVGKVCVIMIR